MARAANWSCSQLFTQLKRNVHNRWCRLKLIWADGAYEDIAPYVRQQFGWRLEVVRRAPDAKGFVVLPRRWVVERSFGWLGRYRRLCRDFEHTTDSSEAMVYIASIRRTLSEKTTDGKAGLSSNVFVLPSPCAMKVAHLGMVALELSCPEHELSQKLLQAGLGLLVGEGSCRVKEIGSITYHDLWLVEGMHI